MGIISKTFPFLLTVIFCAAISGCSNKKSDISFKAMDTIITIQSWGKTSEKANLKAKEKLLQIESLISVNLPESDLYKINHSNQNQIEISDVTKELLMLSLPLAEKSNGALNPALYPITSAWGFTTGEYKNPGEEKINELLPLCNYKTLKLQENFLIKEPGQALDFGAIGKGYAGDQLLITLKENGAKAALIDLGGNIQTLGTKPDGSEWKIGIKNPFGQGIYGILSTGQGAVITSGGYERFFEDENNKKFIHILDGNTGYPVENEIASVTISGATGAYCDALSTTLFVLGLDKAVEFWKSKPDFDFIIITNNKKLYITKNIEKKFKLTGEFTESEIIAVE